MFWVILLALCLTGLLWANEHFWGKSKVEAENQGLKQQVILLESQLAPFKTIALEKYPGRLEDALRKLTNDVETLEAAITKAERRIRSLDLELTVEFTAPWIGEVPTEWFKFDNGREGKTVGLKLALANGQTVQITMVDMDDLKMEKVANGKTRLSYRCKAQLRSPIFGVFTDDVRSIREVDFQLLGLTKDRIEVKPVKFHTASFAFLVNGQETWKARADVNWETTIEGEQIGGIVMTGKTDIPLEPAFEVKVQSPSDQK